MLDACECFRCNSMCLDGAISGLLSSITHFTVNANDILCQRF